MAAHEIVAGVSIDPWELDAGFERGSLESLALGLRNALWSHFQIFDEGEVLVVYIGGDRVEAEEDPIEVMARDTTNYLSRITIPPQLLRALDAVRSKNMPDSCFAVWPCECEEYCDQSHGEGRLELEIRRPTFHELAVAQTRKQSRRPSAQG